MRRKISKFQIIFTIILTITSQSLFVSHAKLRLVIKIYYFQFDKIDNLLNLLVADILNFVNVQRFTDVDKIKKN